MWTKTKTLLAGAGLITVLAMGSTAIAEGPGSERGPRGGHGPPMMRIVLQLDLDAEQEAMLQDFKADHKGFREDNREQVQKLKQTIKAELESDKPNSRVIHATIDQLEAIKSDAKHTMMDNFLSLQATFTPAQKAEFQELLANPPERPPRGQGRQRGGPQDGPGFDGGPPLDGF